MKENKTQSNCKRENCTPFFVVIIQAPQSQTVNLHFLTLSRSSFQYSENSHLPFLLRISGTALLLLHFSYSCCPSLYAFFSSFLLKRHSFCLIFSHFTLSLSLTLSFIMLHRMWFGVFLLALIFSGSSHPLFVSFCPLQVRMFRGIFFSISASTVSREVFSLSLRVTIVTKIESQIFLFLRKRGLIFAPQ